MIQIIYHPASIEDFKAAVNFMSEKGLSNAAPSVSRPVASEENGPYVKRFLKEKGQERFRLTTDERALMEEKGYTREQIAQIRLEGIESVSDSVEEVQPVGKSEGFVAFFDEDEEEEQQRRDEKHGLYGGKEDSAN